jgi:lipopolysaccharide/colanic/teichoic acid biosynthesis glycosyltransferase
MDVVIALMALVLLAPTVLMITALRTHAGRAIFDSEDYVGFNGRAFTSYTFGTLPEEHASYWVRACLRILHDSRLDRLPLLFSVLRGDMSLGLAPGRCGSAILMVKDAALKSTSPRGRD